jgi:hypothetical protein
MRILTRPKGEIILCRGIDKNVKNKFRYEWLETVVKVESKKHGLAETEVKLSDCIDKIDIAGKATCKYCSDLINYGGKGKISLTDHVKTDKHLEKVKHNFWRGFDA